MALAIGCFKSTAEISASFIQRCGSLLNLNLQFHLLVLDGAYVCQENKRAFFHKISDPGDQDIAELLESIIEAVELCLRKRGLLDEQVESEIPEDLHCIEAASRLLRRMFSKKKLPTQ